MTAEEQIGQLEAENAALPEQSFGNNQAHLMWGRGIKTRHVLLINMPFYHEQGEFAVHPEAKVLKKRTICLQGMIAEQW
jgi:hypothetical protein